MREIRVDLEHLREAFGGEVFGPSGDRLGTLAGVYLDDESGSPEWIEVKTGLLQRRLVPLDKAQVALQRVDVAYERRLVDSAPKVTTRGGVVPPDEEQQLYEYYEIPGEHTPHLLRAA
jgi:sporulation protein YlmC with PRC-barrel domain